MCVVPVSATVPSVQWHPLSTEGTQLGVLHQLLLHAPDAEVVLTRVAAVPVRSCIVQECTKSWTSLQSKIQKEIKDRMA